MDAGEKEARSTHYVESSLTEWQVHYCRTAQFLRTTDRPRSRSDRDEHAWHFLSLSLSYLLGTRIPKAPVLRSVAQHRRQENPIGVFDSKHCVTPDAIGVNDDLLEESFICSITPIDDRPSVPNTRSILPEYSATAAPAPSLLLMNYQYSPGILRRPSDQPHILGSHRVVSIPSKFRFHWLALAFDLTSLVLVDTFSFQSNGC